jgi:fibronectin-binding autotransporter adhesin
MLLHRRSVVVPLRVPGIGGLPRALALLVLLGFTGSISLHAQFTWSDASGTDHNVSNAANWSPGLPTGTPDLIFGTASQPSVNFDSAFTVNSVTFSGNQLYAITGVPALTIVDGGLITNSSSATGSLLVAIPVILNGAVTVNNSSGTTGLIMQGLVSGSGSLTVNNTSNFLLELINGGTYTGGTTISTGTLQIGNGAQTGVVFSGAVANSGTLKFNPASADTISYAGVISGMGAVTANGAGTISFSGANTYSGVTFVSNGTLADGVANAFSPNSQIQVSSGGTLAVNHNETIGGLRDGAGAGTVNLGSGVTLTVNTTGIPGPLSGTITGTGGSLVTGGAGTMTLSGANTYDGGTIVSSGILVANNASGSATGSGTVTINSGATFQVGAIGVGTAGAISGNVVDNGTLSFGDIVTFGESISGSGVLTVVTGANATLTGSSNNYTGFTSVNGTLADGTLNPSFSPNSVMIVNSAAGHLTVNTNETIAGLTNGGSGGPVSIVNGGTALTINTSTLNPTPFGGLISGAGGLTLSGSGSFGLSAANTYTGPTTINGGTLFLTGVNAIGSSTITVASGATLEFGLVGGGTTNATAGGSITDNGTVKFNLTSGTPVNNVISGTGTLTKLTGGALTLTAANTYSGGTTVSNGTLFITNSSGSGIGTGSLTIASGAIFQIGSGGITGAISGSTSIVNNGNFNFKLSSAVSFGNTISGTGGALQQLGSGTLTFTTAGVATYSGATTIFAGTITDGVDNAFSSNSTFNVGTAGTLQVANNEIIAGLTDNNGGGIPSQGGAVSIASGKTLSIANNLGTLRFSGVISGAGGVVIDGTGTTIFGGADTYAGGTTINSGANLQLGYANYTGALINGDGTIAGSVTDNGTLTFVEGISNGADITYSNPTSGSGAVVVNTTGSNVIIPNANTYTGGTTVTAGTLVVTNTTGSALGTGAVTLNSTTPGTFGSGGALLGNGSFTGAFAVTGGSLVFPGTINSGAMTMLPGTLSVGATTLAGGAGMVLDFNNATGTAGTNWSLLSISGALTITATSGSQFVLALNTTDPGTNGVGQASNFDPASSYSWEIVATTGGITGFSASAFTTNLSPPQLPGFSNSTLGGTFSVSQVGNDLFLNFTPVPEPSTWALLLTGSVMMAGGAWRRKRAGKLF